MTPTADGDFEASLEDLIDWTGLSARRLQQLAESGVVIRRGRDRYALKASIRALIARSPAREPVTLEEALAEALGAGTLG